MDSSKPSIDIYQIVTDTIISLLEKGVVPWQKPWKPSGMPMNALSKRPYRGINFWLLTTLPYQHQLYLTWEQIKSVGGSVLKDEHGHLIVFWKHVAKKPAETDADGIPKTNPLLRYYKVFNLEQCRDIPTHLVPDSPPLNEVLEPISICESVLAGMTDPPKIEHKANEAFYIPNTDTINMPKKKNFKSMESFYSILWHELVHSTGIEKRLNRPGIVDIKPFGTESYAQEELIAEMGSAFLCGMTGILPNEVKNKAAYLANWLQVLKGNKRFLITAAGQAQKAADYILGKPGDVSENVEETVTESVVG